ncbi:type II toxin-antitoxin system VapC family toxin [Myxococcus sp. AM001]|nr:type II toxin-antitoxin system VapC family toxin [Myxococcus sp. AM001]
MMDPDLLPTSALIDTNVFLRSFGDRPNDKTAPACKEFVDAMLAARRDVLLAAPTVAEILRFRRGTQLPVMDRFIVVPFDDDAARFLGTTFPEDVLVGWAKKTANPLHYYKYDAMIVACAVRWNARCVVALDQGLRDLAAGQGLRVESPDNFRHRQGTLALVPPEAPTSVTAKSAVK